MVDVQLLMTKYQTLDSSLLNSDSDPDRDPDKVPRTTVDPRWTPAFYGALQTDQSCPLSAASPQSGVKGLLPK